MKVQDGCSFSCNFCVIPLRARRLAQPPRGRRARRDPPPRRPGPPRGRPHRDQPRLLPRPRGGLRPAAPGPRGGRDARARAAAAVVDRGQPRERARSLAALRETPTVSRHLHVPLQSGDDGVLRAMARRYDSRPICAGSRSRRRLQPDDRRDRRLPRRGRARVRGTRCASSRRSGATKVHVFPYSPRPGHRHRAARTPVPKHVKKERSARLRAAVARGVPAALARRSARGRRARRPPGPRLRRRLLAVARRRAGRRARPRARRARSRRRGSWLRERPNCIFCKIVARRAAGDRRQPHRRASSRSRTSTRRPTSTCSSSPSGTSPTSARSACSPPDESKRMLEFIAETAEKAGLEEYRVMNFCGAGRRADRLPPALARSGWDDAGDAGMSLIDATRGRADRRR